MSKIRLVSVCCQEDLQTEEGEFFRPLLRSVEEVRAAVANGQPVFCAGCGEDVERWFERSDKGLVALREP